MKMSKGCYYATLQNYQKTTTIMCRLLSTASSIKPSPKEIEVLGQKYQTDNWTNITPTIISKLGKNLHARPYHPLSLVRQRIVNHFYKQFLNRVGNPMFSIYDNINPIVTTEQNFDSLLVPKNHPSRNKSDCYYINQNTMLRAHTTAHQAELISMGLDNFLVIGDVYRRDEIDSTHYPVFHQADAVRLCMKDEVFQNVNDVKGLELFDHNGTENENKQACHTLEAVKMMEHELKSTLILMTQSIFGDIQYRWNTEYFPFTHPSWELEIFYNDKWIEILGCGIMRQEILEKSGTKDRIGWAFGLGLERLAMCLYDIPDIRLFWSEDTGFLNQFKVDNIDQQIKYQPISVYPQCAMDISFWLPEDNNYCSKDFYDIVREIAGEMVEQILFKDEFTHPQTNRTSHCYGIVYRHMERNLTRREVTAIHYNIRKVVECRLNVNVRL